MTVSAHEWDLARLEEAMLNLLGCHGDAVDALLARYGYQRDTTWHERPEGRAPANLADLWERRERRMDQRSEDR